jgi:hypothetical protein
VLTLQQGKEGVAFLKKLQFDTPLDPSPANWARAQPSKDGLWVSWGSAPGGESLSDLACGDTPEKALRVKDASQMQSAMRHGMARRKREFVDAAGKRCHEALVFLFLFLSCLLQACFSLAYRWNEKKKLVIPRQDGDEWIAIGDGRLVAIGPPCLVSSPAANRLCAW